MIAFLGGICGGNECVACRDGNRLVGSLAVIVNEGDVNIVDPQSLEGDIVIAELSRDSDNIINGGILNACIDPAHEGRAVFADLGNEGSIDCVADVGGDTCVGGINEAVGAGRKCAAVSIEGDGAVGADRMPVVYLDIDCVVIHINDIGFDTTVSTNGQINVCHIAFFRLNGTFEEEEIAPAACRVKNRKVKLRKPLVTANYFISFICIHIVQGNCIVTIGIILCNIAILNQIFISRTSCGIDFVKCT